VKPACLHVTKNIPSIYSLEAIGWDKTDFLGNSSGHLLRVTLNLVDHSKCAEKFPKNEFRLKNGIIEEFHICAGDSSGKDTCPVKSDYLDSGFFLYVNFRGTPVDLFSTCMRVLGKLWLTLLLQVSVHLEEVAG
jgi:hypothetical protein